MSPAATTAMPGAPSGTAPAPAVAVLRPRPSQRVLKASALAIGAANALRHAVRGYRTPRPRAAASPAEELAYARGVVERWTGPSGIAFAGARVLEVGPGFSLATGLLALAHGAAAYRAIDRFDVRMDGAHDVHAQIARALQVPGRERDLAYGLVTFPDLPELPDGAHDAIVSNATFEHVDDVEATFRALRRAAAPGARMAHWIDGRTHTRPFNLRDPLSMYRFAPRTYERVLGFPGAPNRLLADDYVRAARAAGWRDARIVPDLELDAAYVDAVHPHLARPYRERPPQAFRPLHYTLVAAA